MPSWALDQLHGDVLAGHGARARRAPVATDAGEASAPGLRSQGTIERTRPATPAVRGGAQVQERAWGEERHDGRSPRSRRAQDTRGARHRNARLRVLIVDDDRLFAEAVKALLARDDGVEVVGYAANGDEGVALAESLAPDLVLMDLEMPVLDGLEATRRIAQRTAAVILILTSSSDRADIAQARRAGAVGLLRKELDPDELVERVLALASAA